MVNIASKYQHASIVIVSMLMLPFRTASEQLAWLNSYQMRLKYITPNQIYYY